MNSVNENKKRKEILSFLALLSPFYRSAEALERRDQHANNVRMKPGLGLKQPPKQLQGLLTNQFKKKEPVVAAESETIDLS